MRALKALVWKELRELRWPAVIALAAYLWPLYFDLRHLGGKNAFVTLVCWVFGMPLMALLVGSYAARDRGRGMVEWASVWPASRATRWAARLVVPAVLLLVVYILILGLMMWILPREAWKELLADPGARTLVFWLLAHLTGTFALFAVVFMSAGISRGPLEAMGITLVWVAGLVMVWVFLAADLLPRFWGPQLGLIYTVFPITTAAWLILLWGLAFGVTSAWSERRTPVLEHHLRWRWCLRIVVPLTLLIVPFFFGAVGWLGAPSPGSIQHLAWATVSPDGQWVAFTDRTESQNSDQGGRLWVMQTDGRGLRCLSRGPVMMARWLPDSRHLLAGWGDAEARVVHILPRPNPYWVWLMSVSGERPRRLSIMPDLDPRTQLPVSISPRGSYAAFGGILVSLKPGLAPPPGKPGSTYANCLWTEDEQPKFIDRATETSLHGGWLIWAMQRYQMIPPPPRPKSWKPAPAHTILEPLAGGKGPTYPGRPVRRVSPNERWLWVQDGAQITVVDLRDGRPRRTFTTRQMGPGPKFLGLAWSPDSGRVVIQAVTGPDHSSQWGMDLWLASPDGTNLRSLGHLKLQMAFGSVDSGLSAEGRLTFPAADRIVSVDVNTGQQTDLFVTTPPERQKRP